jgi:type IX secretion system PorP/SprF family membrane protein
MKKRLNILIGVVAITFVTSVSAQQTRQTNMYNYNKYSLNPAYAGYSGCTEVNFSHLNQWVKVDGAPLTNFLSANTRLGKNFGIGANMILDRSGMMQQFTSELGVSYGLTIAREHRLRFGASIGMLQLQVDPTDAIAIDSGDELVESGIQSSIALNSGAGILYAFKGLELSFSSQQLIETRTNATYNTFEGYGLKRHFTGYGAYDIVLNKKFSLKPSLMYKGIGTVNQFDINTDLNYNDFIYGGVGYRTDVGIIGRVGVNIRKLFFVGYSYEIPLHNIATYGSGSHEIALGLKFCKKDKSEIVPEDIVVEPQIDTVTIVETIVDTVVIEKLDTVYIADAVSDERMRQAAFDASQSLEFEYDKSIIIKSSYGNLESLVNMMLIREDVKIKLSGHTDNQGTEAYNMRLSKNRVEAVKEFIVANGVDPARIQTEHFGESKPIADNSTEEGRRTNRRVEMTILNE